MNKSVRTSFVFAGLVIIGSFFSVAAIQAQGPIPDILKRMEDHYNALTSLKAGLKMEKVNVQTGDHDVSEGSIVFIPQKGRDAAFRIDWVKPAEESLSVVNKQYLIYRVKTGTAITGSVGNMKGGKGTGILSILNMSKADLKANFEINYAGQEGVSGSVQTWHLQLVPKGPADYKNADIWVDGNGMPVQMKQTEKNNDTTTILLSNLNKNSQINAKEVLITLPKGLKPTKG